MMDIFKVKAVPPPADESQRRQYEEWLGETQQLLQMQQRLLEDQIAAHRKTKKSLSAKQRTAKKAGRAFAEEDAAQLRNVTEQQGVVQKQLEQVHPHQKHHPDQPQSEPLPVVYYQLVRLHVHALRAQTREVCCCCCCC